MRTDGAAVVTKLTTLPAWLTRGVGPNLLLCLSSSLLACTLPMPTQIVED